jgi:hypothetical protein
MKQRQYFNLLSLLGDLDERPMTLLIRFQVLLLSALLAHGLAGGTFVETPNLLWQGFCLGALLLGTRSLKLQGPSLALVILLVQSASHFILGGGTYLNETRMTMAHFISGAISYFGIAFDFITSALKAIVPGKPFAIFSIPESFCRPAFGGNSTFQIRQLTASLKFRGPPLFWEI